MAGPLNTADIFHGDHAVRISHNGDNAYVLRRTQQSNLLLYKPTPKEPAMHPAMHPAMDFSNLRTVNSEDLLRGQKSVEILHLGKVYILRETKLGKLVMGK